VAFGPPHVGDLKDIAVGRDRRRCPFESWRLVWLIWWGPNAKKRRFAVQLQVQISQDVTFIDLETRQAISSTIGKIHIRSTEQYNQISRKIWPFQTPVLLNQKQIHRLWR